MSECACVGVRECKYVLNDGRYLHLNNKKTQLNHFWLIFDVCLHFYICWWMSNSLKGDNCSRQEKK